MDDDSIHRGEGKDIGRSHLYLSWKMATEKFRLLAEPTLGKRAVSGIIRLVGSLEELDGVEKITKVLVPRKAIGVRPLLDSSRLDFSMVRPVRSRTTATETSHVLTTALLQ